MTEDVIFKFVVLVVYPLCLLIPVLSYVCREGT